jgi:hypothetical protein
LAALAFKVMMDEGRKITFLRIYAGRIQVNEDLYNVVKKKKEKLSRILKMHANKRERIDQAVGVFLSAGGGSWTTMSDRNEKEDLEPVNGLEVLNKVTALPVATWKYKSQNASVRHIGPMAQDFKAAFAVGESETGITTVDADGVALAAIQGLNQKLQEELGSVRADNAALKARLDRLEQLLNTHNGGGQ